MTIIIDSNVLIAYDNPREENHRKAVEIMVNIKNREFGEAIVLDYVFDETLTFIAGRQGKVTALNLGQNVLSSSAVLAFANSVLFYEAWKIFQKSSELSFTDCVIVAFAREKNAAIATFDGHFSQFKDLRIVS